MAMWKLEALLDSANAQCKINGEYVPARPENYKIRYCGIFRRIAFAWQVICGKAETFTWPEMESEIHRTTNKVSH